MPRRCSICDLPPETLSEVNILLSERVVSLTEIAERFAPTRFGAPKLSRSALDRHRRNCLARTQALAEMAPARPEIVPARENRLLAISESVQGRLETLLQSAVGFLEGAETLSDPKAGLGAIREIRKALELVARITGELQAATNQIAVQVNTPQPTADFSKLTTPELIELKRLITKARGTA